MLASLRAEILKLRKRPATWLLASIWSVLVVLFGYLLIYALFSNPPEGSLPPGTNPKATLGSLYPAELLPTVLRGFSGSGGGPIALILGALLVGSEYGWGTVKTVLTQRPGRLAVLSGKASAFLLALLLFSLLAFAAGAVSSLVIATIEDAPVRWPDVSDLVRAALAGWLILAAWGTLGFALAALFRGTALAIGLGIVYAVVLEGIAGSLLASSENFEWVRRAFLSESSSALANSFGDPPAGLATVEPTVGPEQAVPILISYAVIFLLVAAFSFWRRDVS